MTNMYHSCCSQCGAELNMVTVPTGKFDKFNGAPTFNWLFVCPNRPTWALFSRHAKYWDGTQLPWDIFRRHDHFSDSV